MKIGFAGLGAMGGPMAGHLLDAGHTLYVLTRRRESANAAIAKGAIWAETPKNLAASSDLVFTVLPGPPEIEAIMAGDDGLRAGFKSGTPYIDLSTNSPALVRQLSADLAKAGVSMLDAPVSGGPKGAASRLLAIWVSGDKATYDNCKPVLDLLGDQVRYLGDSGNASVAKLVHNCANYGIQMVLAEAFTLGVKAGVDPVALFAA
jgi:3-hydroxyisobutyrate dehydrogenase-like beta-hydroxyacid dehydrogenase